jgi:hypothetical protein
MEEDSIIEWISYHSSLGFEHFFIYGNDEDHRILAAALAPLIACKLVTFVHCPSQGAQADMYFHFLHHYLDSCEWISFLDQDEFIRLDSFGNKIENLTTQARMYDSIQFQWICYGTSGFEERPKGSVLSQYTKREGVVHVLTKHITRTSAIYRDIFPNVDPVLWEFFPFWHVWPTFAVRTCSSAIEPATALEWHGGGERRTAYESYLRDNGAMLLQSATVAHFHLKSRADCERRFRRGTARNFHGQQMYADMLANPEAQNAYIVKGNEVEDSYLASYWESYVRSCAGSAPFLWEAGWQMPVKL